MNIIRILAKKPKTLLKYALSFCVWLGSLHAPNAWGEKFTEVFGEILLDDKEDLSKIRIRIPGLSSAVVPDSEGKFKFTNVPLYSSASFLVSNEEGKYNQRIIPFFATGETTSHRISLEKNSLINDVSALFQRPQDITKSGFCGALTQRQPEELLGGRILLQREEGTKSFPVSYFNANSLPDKNQSFLASHGRFCAFNLQTGFYKVTVKLKRGPAKSFVLYLSDSYFESDLQFSLEDHLVGLEESFVLQDAPVAESFILNMGASGGNRWLVGLSQPTWQKVRHFSLAFNFSNQFSPVIQKEKVSIDRPSLHGFSYLNYKGLYETQSSFFMLSPAKSEDTKLCLNLLDTGILHDFKKALQRKNNIKNGALFVSFVEEGDVDFDLISLTTGLTTGVFAPILGNKIKNSGFFMDIPTGQYLLRVKETAANGGAIKWFALVSSIGGKIQIVTNKFTCDVGKDNHVKS